MFPNLFKNNYETFELESEIMSRTYLEFKKIYGDKLKFLPPAYDCMILLIKDMLIETDPDFVAAESKEEREKRRQRIEKSFEKDFISILTNVTRTVIRERLKRIQQSVQCLI